jgi:hypothetical protein
MGLNIATESLVFPWKAQPYSGADPGGPDPLKFLEILQFENWKLEIRYLASFIASLCHRRVKIRHYISTLDTVTKYEYFGTAQLTTVARNTQL